MENNENLPLNLSLGSWGRSNDNKDKVQNEILKAEVARLNSEVEDIKKKNTEAHAKISELERKNEEQINENRGLKTLLMDWQAYAGIEHCSATFANEDKLSAQERAAAAELRASAAEERCKNLEEQLANLSRVDRWVAEIDPIIDVETFSDTSSVVFLEHVFPQDVNGGHAHAPVVDLEEENAYAEDGVLGTSVEVPSTSSSVPPARCSASAFKSIPGKGRRTRNRGGKREKKSTHACKCGKSFRSAWHLKYHIKNYVERKFRCRICKRKFRFCRDLLTHLKHTHGMMPRDERKYGCCKCSERFLKSKDRHTHWLELHAKEIKQERIEDQLNEVSRAPEEEVSGGAMESVSADN